MRVPTSYRAGSPATVPGFTYLVLLFAVAIAGVGLAAAGVMWHTAQQRGKEAELLFIGEEFREAIALYYYRTPGQVREYPRALGELLEDPRYPSVQRYLRRIYRDPMTGRPEWGLVRTPEGRIMGVYSLSKERPVKVSNFAEAHKAFANKAAYADWKFIFEPPVALSPSPPK